MEKLGFAKLDEEEKLNFHNYSNNDCCLQQLVSDKKPEDQNINKNCYYNFTGSVALKRLER